MRSITEVRCVRCKHPITDHMAEGEHPDHPGMPCERRGCECFDFHYCGLPECGECNSAEASDDG